MFLKTRYFLILSVILLLIATGCNSTNSTQTGNQDSPTDETVKEFAFPEENYYEEPLAPLEGDFTQSAYDLVVKMKSGWNLGNTFDAPTETGWGQPVTTKAMIEGIKNAGFNTIRIPVSWHNHVNKNLTINRDFILRVKEVVDWAIESDLYVIINSHHDNCKEGYFPNDKNAVSSQAFISRVWKQVGLQFRNYNEHLLFETMNEPRITGYANEWNWNDNDTILVEAAENINILNQLAIDTIRSTGGNNTNRFILFTPYVASTSSAISDYFKVPTDNASDKLILSIHAYTPYVFAMQDPGAKTFSASHKSDINWFMDTLNTNFIDGKGIPVIIGEYGATNKDNLADREAFFEYYVSKAHSYGMCPIVWDNNSWEVKNGKYNELYGYYNRIKQTWYFPTLIEKIIEN